MGYCRSGEEAQGKGQGGKGEKQGNWAMFLTSHGQSLQTGHCRSLKGVDASAAQRWDSSWQCQCAHSSNNS